MADEPDATEPQGSWLPYIVVAVLLIAFIANRIANGTDRTSIRIKRYYNVQVSLYMLDVVESGEN